MTRIIWKTIVDKEENGVKYVHSVFDDYVKGLIEDFPFEDYDEEEYGPHETFAEKVNYVRRVFNREIGDWRGRGILDVEYWIAGCCSLNVPFYYSDIIKLGHEMVERKVWTEENEGEFCDLWFNLVAERVWRLFGKYYKED